MAIKSKKWKPISTVYQTDSYLMTPNCYHKILSSCNSIRSSHVKSVSRTASCQNCRHWGDFVTGRRPARKAECDWVSWAALELKQLTSRRSHVMWARGVPLTIPLLPAFRAILTILRHNYSHFYNRQVYASCCSRECRCLFYTCPFYWAPPKVLVDQFQYSAICLKKIYWLVYVHRVLILCEKLIYGKVKWTWLPKFHLIKP